MVGSSGSILPRRDLALMVSAMERELNRIGNDMVRDALKHLSDNNKDDTATLAKSIRYQISWQGDHFLLEFGTGAKHAYFVENGRRPGGKFPPADKIRRWSVRKLGLKGTELKNAVYLIRRKIAKQGIKPSPFIKPVVDDFTQTLTLRIDTAVKQALGNAV